MIKNVTSQCSFLHILSKVQSNHTLLNIVNLQKETQRNRIKSIEKMWKFLIYLRWFYCVHTGAQYMKKLRYCICNICWFYDLCAVSKQWCERNKNSSKHQFCTVWEVIFEQSIQQFSSMRTFHTRLLYPVLCFNSILLRLLTILQVNAENFECNIA